ncbi:MAG: agmatinase [Candidatus Omnitrophota bacterium]|nr:agmatinase [Candidatus Omnitrophota bacterium]
MEIPYTFAGLPPLPLEKARVAILPVAYDGTTSYQAGTRFGPQEIILASRFLEMYDESLGFEPSDLGIATLPELWPDLSRPEAAVNEVEKYVTKILKKRVFPVILGGEHSITAGAVKAFYKIYPKLSVLTLDAHADLRETYQGTRYNHACVSRRIMEMGIPTTIMGVRCIPSEDLPLLSPPLSLPPRGGGVGGGAKLKVIWAEKLKEKKDWLSLISANLTEYVYLSIDLDFFDPAEVPAVGTPEPGGLGWSETNRFLRRLAQKHRVVGFDVVELNGGLHHTPSSYFASRLVYRLIGLCNKKS